MPEGEGKRMRRCWRCVLLILFIMGLAVVALLVVFVSTGWFGYKHGPKLVRRIVAAAGERIDGRLAIKDARIDLTRGMTLSGVSVTASGEQQPAFAADSVLVALDPIQLLAGRAVARRIVIEKPKVRIVVGADGKTNLERMIRPTGRAPAPMPADLLDWGVLLTGADVEYTDPQAYGDETPRRLSDWRVELTPEPGRPARWRISADPDGGRFTGASVRAYVDVDGDRVEYFVDLRVSGAPADSETLALIPGIGKRLQEELRPEGKLSAMVLIGSGARPGGGPRVRGSVVLSDITLHPKGFRGELKHVAGMVTFTDRFVEFHDVRAGIEPGGAAKGERGVREDMVRLSGYYDAGSGQGALRIGAEMVHVSAALTGLLPDDAAALYRALGPEGYLGARGLMRIDIGSDPPVEPIVSIDCDDLSLHIDGRTLIGSRFGTLPVTSISAAVFAERNKVKGTLHQASVCGGFLEDGVFVLNSDGQGINYSGRIRLSDVQLAQLTACVLPGTEPKVGVVSGRIEWRSTIGRSTAGGSGSGFRVDGEIHIEKGELHQLPLLMGLFPALQLRLPKREDLIRTADARFTVTNEGVNFDKVELISDDLQVTAKGTVSSAGALDLRLVTATRAKGGIPIISGALRVVMGGVESELTRVRVTGTLEQPKYELSVLKPLTHPLRTLADALDFF